MATMKEQATWFMERLERQVRRMVRLELECERLEKEAHRMQAVINRQEVACQRLEAKMSDALDILESLAAEESTDLLIYWGNAQAFIRKWAPPHDVTELLGEEAVLSYAPDEASVNGR